jgi:hypothetical protein
LAGSRRYGREKRGLAGGLNRAAYPTRQLQPPVGGRDRLQAPAAGREVEIKGNVGEPVSRSAYSNPRSISNGVDILEGAPALLRNIAPSQQVGPKDISLTHTTKHDFDRHLCATCGERVTVQTANGWVGVPRR